MGDIVRTKYKILPAIGRIFLALVALGGLIFIVVIIQAFINEPSTFALFMLLTYSSITFVAIGVGPLSLKTFIVDKENLEERILGGLIQRKTKLVDILGFNERPSRYGNELILNKADEETIFIQEFDQKGYSELKRVLSNSLKVDPKTEPTYWNKSKKVICFILCIWYGIICGAIFLISFS